MIVAGSIFAFAYTATLYTKGAAIYQPTVTDGADPLGLVIKWLLLPATCVALGIAKVAQKRLKISELITGNRPIEGSHPDIDIRFLQNTVEQALLCLLVWPALALSLPPMKLGIIPALAVSFVAMRLLFWAGYHIAPTLRAFGFAGTFYPTLVALVYALYLNFQA